MAFYFNINISKLFLYPSIRARESTHLPVKGFDLLFVLEFLFVILILSLSVFTFYCFRIVNYIRFYLLSETGKKWKNF